MTRSHAAKTEAARVRAAAQERAAAQAQLGLGLPSSPATHASTPARQPGGLPANGVPIGDARALAQAAARSAPTPAPSQAGFVKMVAEYVAKRGQTFPGVPSVDGRHLDLSRLFGLVTKMGGSEVVRLLFLSPLPFPPFANFCRCRSRQIDYGRTLRVVSATFRRSKISNIRTSGFKRFPKSASSAASFVFRELTRIFRRVTNRRCRSSKALGCKLSSSALHKLPHKRRSPVPPPAPAPTPPVLQALLSPPLLPLPPPPSLLKMLSPPPRLRNLSPQRLPSLLRTTPSTLPGLPLPSHRMVRDLRRRRISGKERRRREQREERARCRHHRSELGSI